MARSLLLLALLVVAAGCGKKERPPEVEPASGNVTETPNPAPVKASGGVPQSLVDRIQRDWPKIEEEGNKFLAEFTKAQAAKNSGDLETMDTAIEAARMHYKNALDGWNEIYYSADDMDEDAMEASRKYMRTWNKKVDAWMKKAKPLKEMMRAK